MALAEMAFSSNAVIGDVEILANSEYVGRAITLDDSAFTGGLCTAGTPITATGTVADVSGAANAIGILLHDVRATRPQGTVVIGGYINTTAAQTHSGVTIDDATKGALNNIIFM